MSARDIMPYKEIETRAFPVAASQSFQAGEPVVVQAAGTLIEAATDPSTIDGIAAHRSTDVDGTDLGVGQRVTVYEVGPRQTFRTNSITSDGAGATALVPTLANIGDFAGLALTGGGVWSLDTGANNLLCKIVGVLDRDGRDLSDPNLLPGTGVTALFTFV